MNGFEVHQMDVRCAFLNGTPEEDLYIRAPLGLDAAPKTALTNALRSIGLKPIYSDPCLYISADESKPFFLFVHVDDLLFGGSWPDIFKEKISAIFDMEDLGLAKYALGIRIDQLGGSIALVQDKYINNMLSKFQINNDQSTMIPLPSNWKQLKNLHPTQSCFCSKFPLPIPGRPKGMPLQGRQTYPTIHQHHQRPTPHSGKNDLKQAPNELIGFSDSDWNGSKSWNSYLASIIYFHGTVGWRSHKQQSVALSSAEGEYVSLSDASQDLLWCMNVLEELRILPQLTLYTDNQSAIAIASNPIYHHGTRHINF
ncbi:hypothetical protein PCASD_06410 [Puccinia coronata f. sp. avenae]|uniref:Reverse transcriptase Ty1/copia-type domain-containing protein n=1 Tax=Puccinia coronata f. sp. avenae TaxID=200324 RepID=A0A2N5UXL4_9BASI|nr:hypothetical protein PCASD_06410 [Puccinia coronata f. sp. avenae]